jgi:hypothetical protein
MYFYYELESRHYQSAFFDKGVKREEKGEKKKKKKVLQLWKVPP